MNKPTKTAAMKCSRCNGTGNWARIGTCYRCGGRRVDPTAKGWAFPADWTAEQVAEWEAQRNARLNAAAEKRAAKRTQEKAADLRRREVSADLAMPTRQALLLLGDERLQQMLAGHGLTDGQLGFVLTLAAREIEKEIHGTPTLELGRQTITAKLLKHDSQQTAFGTREVVTLRAENGAILWGTCPQTMYRVEPGQTVTVTLTVETGWADGCYRFKRPTLKNALRGA